MNGFEIKNEREELRLRLESMKERVKLLNKKKEEYLAGRKIEEFSPSFRHSINNLGLVSFLSEEGFIKSILNDGNIDDSLRITEAIEQSLNDWDTYYNLLETYPEFKVAELGSVGFFPGIFADNISTTDLLKRYEAELKSRYKF